MPSTKPALDFQGLWVTETDKQVTQTCGAQLRSLSLCGIPRVPHLTSSRLSSKAQICCRLCVHDAKNKSEGRFSGAGQLKQCSQHPFLKIISWEFLKIFPSVRREVSVQLYQWGSWVQMAEQMSCKHTESLKATHSMIQVGRDPQRVSGLPSTQGRTKKPMFLTMGLDLIQKKHSPASKVRFYMSYLSHK